MRTLLTLTLLTTSTLALHGVLHAPRSTTALHKRSTTLSQHQGYYPISDMCTGTGTTCASICGSDTLECPSNDSSMLSCHSINDGSYCCTDSTGSMFFSPATSFSLPPYLSLCIFFLVHQKANRIADN